MDWIKLITKLRKRRGEKKREKKNAILISRSFCELAANFCPLFFH